MPAKVDHDARRRELLSAAFHTFARDGYAACTMRGLARSLGVSTGTLYHYFDGKDAVFVAMFKQLNEDIITSATDELTEESTAEDRLTVLLGFLARHLDQLQAVIRIALEYHRHHPDPDSRAWLAGITRRYVHTFQSHIGFANPGEARVMMSLLTGAVVHQLLDDEAVDLIDHITWVRRAMPVPG